MDGVVTTIVLIMLILIGVVTYYLYDYYYYKVKVADDFDKTNKRVDTESTTRTSYDQDLVDQVNTVNSKIEDDVDDIRSDMRTDATNLEQVVSGINNVMSFSTPGAGGASATAVSLSDLSGATNPDMSLLSHVNALGGFTIKDLENTAGSMKKLRICGNGNPPRCIEIPDQNGDVLLTNLYRDKAISIDGRTTISAALSFKDAGTIGASIRAVNGAGFIETGKLGIGTTVATPTASLHLLTQANDATTPFKVSVGANDLFSIDKDGTVNAKKVKLSPTGSATSTGTIEAVDSGIKIAASTVVVDGNVNVTGTVVSQQTPVAAAPAPAPAPAPTPAPAPATEPAPPVVSGFTSGPIRMRKEVRTPVDYMNSRYLMPVH